MNSQRPSDDVLNEFSQFQRAGAGGSQPRVEHFLALHPDLGSSSAVLQDLIYAEVCRREEAVELAEVVARFPDLARELSQMWELHRALASAETPAAETPARNSLDDTNTHRPAASGDTPADSGSPASGCGRLGEYELLSEIARGGMGVVYKARHRQLGRIAAVKLIKTGELADADELRRFQSEGEAAALLDHPHIVPLFEVGEHEGRRYMALAFVDGPSLWHRVRQSPLEPLEAARLMQPVCEAIHYAHSRGIIHRDLKPQNILLTPEGQAKVTDFGLAKRQLGDSSLTATGSALGTPGYMPPEQAAGRHDEVGAAADVYSLGATLYALVTGRAPFQAASVAETLRQVLDAEPVAPRTLNPAVPLDLETICLKCLAKEPAARYASAQALAEDLGRFLSGEPITARPITAVERGWRWCTRNPWIAAPLAASAALLAAVAVVSIFAYFQQKSLVGDLRIELARSSFAHGVSEREAGRLASAERDFIKAWALLPRDHPLEDDYRQVAWDVISKKSRQAIPMPRHRDNIVSTEFSPDRTRIATASHDHSARIWNSETGAPIGKPMQHARSVLSAVFSPDGSRIVTGSDDQTARIWDARTCEPIGRPLLHGETGVRATYSEDGKWIITRAYSAAQVWDAITGERAGGPLLIPEFGSCEVSPNGTRILLHDTQGAAELWKTSRIPSVIAKFKHGGRIESVDFSQDGRFIVTASQDHTARVWNAETGEPSAPSLLHDSAVTSAKFSPDCIRVVTVSNQVAYCWNAITGARIGEPMRHDEHIDIETLPVFTATFTPDASRILTASRNQMRTWDASGRPVEQGDGFVIGPSDSADGAQALVNLEGAACVLGIQPHVPEMLERDGVDHVVYYGSDGTKLLTVEYVSGIAQLRDSASREPIGKPLPLEGSVFRAAMSRDQQRISIVSFEDMCRVWDISTGNAVGPGVPHIHTKPFAFNGSGTRLALATADNTVQLRDPQSGTPIGTPITSPKQIYSITFSPDDARIVTTDADAARFWDANTGLPVASPVEHAGITTLEYNPEGTLLLTAGFYDAAARTWDATTGLPAGPAMLHDNGHDVHAKFSPTGQHILTTCREVVRVWDTSTGKLVGEPMRQDSHVSFAIFSLDERLIITIADNSLRVWNAKTCASIGEPLQVSGGVETKAFVINRDQILTTAPACRWDIAKAPPAADFSDVIARWCAVGIDESGTTRELSYDEWQALWQPQEGLPPAAGWQAKMNALRAARTLRWHTQAASFSEAAKNWFAAVFHLRRLIAFEKSDADLQKRLKQAEAQWEQQKKELARPSQLPATPPPP